jgi:hypothetical protein
MNNIKKKYHYFLIGLITIMYFITMPIQQPVMAVSVNYDFGFEGTVAGSPITEGLPVVSDNIFTSDKEGAETTNFAVTSANYRSGSRCFKWGADSSGWFNATYSKNNYLANFSIWINVADAFMLYFYNSSLGLTTGTIILFKFVVAGTDLFYNNEVNTSVLIDTAFSGGYQMLSFNIDNNLGDVTYITDTNKVVGVAKGSSLINTGYRIDSIKFHDMSSGTFYFDDMNWTLSSNYNGTGGGTTGCNELYKNDQWIGTGFTGCLGTVLLKDVLLPLYYVEKYVELVNGYEINGDISGFEIAINPTMDNDLSNYFLYINGMSMGNPCEMEGFASGSTSLDKLKWDITGLTLQNESVVIELYHNSLSWNLGYNGDSTNVYGPQYPGECIYHSHNSFIDGILNYNITRVTRRAMYKIYFSNVTSGGENPDYDNSLVVKGNGVNATDGIQWTNKYDTVYFDVHVNDTIYDYYINVYKDGVAIGENQYYPIYITSYQEMHGYTPEAIGTYKVILMRTGDYEVLNETFWVKNITAIQSRYVIYTAPNPSFMNNDYTVFVLIDDGDIYNYYYARAFVYSSDTFNYNDGFGGGVINAIGSLTSFNFAHNKGNLDYHYWRIFGSDDGITFFPLGDVYNHYIDRSLIDTPYLSLSTYSIMLGDTINILGFHPIGLDYAVFIGSTNAFDVSGQVNFNIPFTPSNKGIYTITLKNKVGGTWITPNPDCVKTLNVNDNTSGGGGGINIFPTVSQPLGSIIGLIVTIFCLLSPFMVSGALHLQNAIHPVIYAFTGGLGLSISTIIGWFPVWIPFFVIACGIIILVVYYLKGANITGE